MKTRRLITASTDDSNQSTDASDYDDDGNGASAGAEQLQQQLLLAMRKALMNKQHIEDGCGGECC